MRRRSFVQSIGTVLAGSVLPINSYAEAPKAKSKPLRFAFFSDIHVKTEEVSQVGMVKAMQHMQRQKGLQFAINGGDAIWDALAVDKAATTIQWNIFKEHLKKENGLPVYHCIGNHDVWGWFNKNEADRQDPKYGKVWVVEELAMLKRYYRFQKERWHFIVLDSTDLNPAGGYIARLDEEQLSWLEKELATIPKNEFVCIVSHIPVLSICAGLFFDKTEPNGDLKIQRNLMHSDFLRIKKLFLQYPQVRTCLSGHIHLQDELDYLGVKYYCNGAISGNWWKGKFQEFAPAYAVFEFFNDGSSTRKIVEY